MGEQTLFKIEVPHTDLGRDDAYHEWVDVWLPEHVREHGPRPVLCDSTGRKNPHGHTWHRWCCNNLACDGVILVNPGAIVAHVNAESSRG